MVFDTIAGLCLLNFVLQTILFVNIVTEDCTGKKKITEQGKGYVRLEST